MMEEVEVVEVVEVFYGNAEAAIPPDRFPGQTHRVRHGMALNQAALRSGAISSIEVCSAVAGTPSFQGKSTG